MPPTDEFAKELARLRAEIDDHNLRLLRVLEARGRTVLSIMQIKRQFELPKYDPAREQQMLADLLSQVTGPYSREQVAEIFAQVLRASRELAAPGPE